MTIRDIAAATWTITRLDITARDDSSMYLHRWIIGEKPPYIKPSSRMYWDERSGKLSIVERKINVHGNRKGNGQPEMGWGLDESAIPAELLDAKISTLGMHCADGIEYEVRVDIILSSLLVDILAQQMESWRKET